MGSGDPNDTLIRQLNMLQLLDDGKRSMQQSWRLQKYRMVGGIEHPKLYSYENPH